MGNANRFEDERQAQLAVGLVAYALQLSPTDIMTQRRGTAEVAYGRQIAMYIVYVGFGISLARVAMAFGRDRSTVAYACHQIEDRRDDPSIDDWLDALEMALRQTAELVGTHEVAA